MTHSEFQSVYEQGPDACFAFFQQMEKQMHTAMQVLTDRVQQLEERLAKDSQIAIPTMALEHEREHSRRHYEAAVRVQECKIDSIITDRKWTSFNSF